MTDAALQRLKPPATGRAEYFDVTLPGFALRIAAATDRRPEGSKTWVLFYRHGGKLKRLTFEPSYPALGLAGARKKAGDALALLETGKDPGEAKAAVKTEAAIQPDTVAGVVADFVKRHLQAKGRAPRYVVETQRNFDLHVLPRWGKRPIKSITRRDVTELLDEVAEQGSTVKGEDGKRRHIPGGPIAANRVLAAVRAMFNWALRRGVVDAVPTTLVERPGAERRKERTLSADEIRTIWAAAKKTAAPFGPFLRVLLLLGQRREETARMRWADLDLPGAVWNIPPEMTKNRRGHIVPLPPLAVATLRTIPRKALLQKDGTTLLSPHVFSSTGAAPISGYSAFKRRFDAAVTKALAEAEANPIPDWDLHDLRRTVGTELGRLGVERFTVSKVLNHTDRSVTGIYDRHTYLPEKQAALGAWAAYVESIMPKEAEA